MIMIDIFMKRGLALISVVFFWFPVFLALLLIFPSSGSSLWAIILVPAGAVSFAGAFLLLQRTVPKTTGRFFVFPLLLDLAAVIACGLYGLFILEAFPSGLTGEIWATTLLLLAPCSVAIFIFIPGENRVRRVSIWLGAFISSYSVLTIIFLFYGGFYPMLGLVYLYWLIGMPATGVCCLANAVFNEEKRSKPKALRGDLIR